MKIQVGKGVPRFSSYDQNDQKYSPDDYRGKWLLIYFYPKDNTPGCTREACAFRDEWSKLKHHKIAILGVSINSAESHKKFIKKFDLPFPLLVDEEKELAKLFGVWGKKKFMGREYMGVMRMSFLIDPSGKVVKIYDNVKPAEHAVEVLNDVKGMAKK